VQLVLQERKLAVRGAAEEIELPPEPARGYRPKACKLAIRPRLRDMVEEKLRCRWSPEQISGWLARAYANDPEMQVSHESIYRTLFVQSRGVLRRELTQYLRTGRVLRRPKGVRLPDGRGGRPNTLHISQRPAEAADRAVPGHWETECCCQAAAAAGAGRGSW